jgi:AcrR family transcriptional regulator
MGIREPPTTRRGQIRREQILRAAAGLVARHGFHAVGVNDIGAAAGVTGGALYRHFDNKTAILIELFESAIDDLLTAARTVRDQPPSSGDTLAALVEEHVAFALRDRAVLTVYSQEQHNLPTEDRRRLRRKQRAYVEIWRTVLGSELPNIGDRRALARVEAVFGLLNAASTVSSSLTDDDLRGELTSMALSALRAPDAHASTP